MNVPTAVYAWQQIYLVAVLETDDRFMRSRIYDALAAIEQRRLSPLDPDGDEDHALSAAESGLQTLIAERAQKPV